MVAHFLSPDQQGFYYTFASIAALKIFFEMGLSFVILQFSSHQFVALRWGREGLVEGDESAVSRFFAFLAKSVKWYGIAALCLLVTVLPVGIVFFGLREPPPPGFTWRGPWALLIVGTALNLLAVPVFAAIEGSGRIVEVYRIRLIQGIAGAMSGWLILLAGESLFFAAANVLVSALAGLGWLFFKNSRLIGQIAASLKHTRLRERSSGKEFSWSKEVWPMQWRIAVSWMSGYFISQLFTPVLFYYHGPIIAGQMGITLALVTILGSIAMTWLNVRAPLFGALIATRSWIELDRVFRAVFWQSLMVMTIGAFGILVLIIALENQPVGKRFLPTMDTGILLCGFIVSHIIGCFAQYLRAHKKEPFVWLSLIGACLMAVSTWVLATNYSVHGVVMGILAVHLLYGLPTGIALWWYLRKKWHDIT